MQRNVRHNIGAAGSMALRLLTAVVVFCGTAAPLFSQPALRITSPENGSEVRPGQTITVTLVPSPEKAFQGVGVIGTDPLGMQLVSGPPYTTKITLPRNMTPRKYMLTGAGRLASGQLVLSTPVEIYVERAEHPGRLSVEPETLELAVGDQLPLSVTAYFGDGTHADVSESRRTIYVCVPKGLATVTAEGMVTARTPGSGRIIVSGMIDVPIFVRAR